MSLLEFQQVGYWYKDKSQPLFQDINISFEKGKFYTIVGTSGTGKTTFLSLAGGLDAPREGQILYGGKAVSKIGLANFRNKYVSIVFQAYNLLPYMTALQNVTTAMEITGSKEKNKEAYALEMLEKVGINEKQARQKVLTLSGGQQQRVSITRAFCCDTDLIAADEPTGNLDEDTSKEIVRLFQDLAHKENKCIIMVTHDEQIARVSDMNIRLSRGSFTVTENAAVV
ncbi:ABC transporter ATP-binding protein [Bacillus mojavensis]|jgi:putative ABC transport system ATP-binding protein|uniref:ABC transporter ATP-binding protein n=1 Tax=Bacillus mojavensis TaxID=72360 RepID=A0AAP3FVQ8_BACMO|nr:ABC transporter ATP-binding protein [Bacillus mojavensis]MCY8105543.1 ABC transporter ATP-binding protein [Bacillus mojavensis]MCY8481955.1 ABC transporter ATP-binding protein [Bacillus mojavensis]MCY8508179.1 ABC transporter ATP-binding protein [Bacillus mojavensis]MEC1291948.1 ABC transporter ATP-binding protein [Bacillus mojavensis]MEC1613881.1 ABC transporter ATP-binding protein [Bacillus mojavensis]